MRRFGPIPVVTLTLLSCSSAPSLPTEPPATVVSTSPAPAPDDAFIKGTVFDTANRPLAGARVQVLDGSHAGTTATVTANGEFSMVGTFEEGTRFRATIDGYISDEEILLAS